MPTPIDGHSMRQKVRYALRIKTEMKGEKSPYPSAYFIG
jgi:hypothetical protein